MRIATIIVRILMGCLLLFASISYFFKLFPEPVLMGNMKVFNDGLAAAVYMMPLVKGVELLVGLALVVGRYVSLAAIVLLPLSINILLINIFLAPEGLPIALFLFLGNAFLVYRYWHNCRCLLAA